MLIIQVLQDKRTFSLHSPKFIKITEILTLSYDKRTV